MLKILKIPQTVYMKLATIAVTTSLVFSARTTGALRHQLMTSKPSTNTIGNQLADKNGVVVMITSTSTPNGSPAVTNPGDHTTPSSTPSTTPTSTGPNITPKTSTSKGTTVQSGTATPTTSSSGGQSSGGGSSRPSTTPRKPSGSTPSSGSSSDGGSTPTTIPTPTPNPTPTSTPTTTPPPSYTYRNGTYYVVGSYSAPSGTESMGITLVVSNDMITDSTVTAMSNNGTSRAYQDDFVSQYKSLVVGKKLAEVFLNKVSISSLTPTGFNNAVTAIRSSAHN